MTQTKTLYSIGEVSKLCHVSRKTLRYYEQLGLITPDEIGDNGYRYYSRNNLRLLPVIKYFKQMGFRLDEIKILITEGPYSVMCGRFQEKISEFELLEKELYSKKLFLKDWYDMLIEAQIVLEQCVSEVSVKFLEDTSLCTMPYDFNFDYKEAIINIDFGNYLEEIENAITGPVMIYYPSLADKQAGIPQKVEILQRAIGPLNDDNKKILPGGLYASVYHIGAHNTLSESYVRLIEWCEKHGYAYDDAAVERYVADYWATEDESQYVTEILVAVKRKEF